jgi:glycosyltransferase involved in cell wall biosynthesis
MSRAGLVAWSEMSAVHKPRILCVMQLPPPLHGVTAINSQIVASRVINERFELDVIPLRFAETIAELGRISPDKLVRAGGVAARLAWALARRRPAAVYLTLAVQRPALYRDLALLALVRAARLPRIVHLHARPDPEVRRLLRQALRGATVILVSPALRPELGDAVEDARVRFVANGIAALVELGEFQREPRPIPRVLFLSNLLVDKGPLVLVEALRLLAARGIAFEVAFAGAPSRELGEAELHHALAPLGNQARYLGPIAAAEVPGLLRAYDVFAYPTLHDAMPLAVLEAMRAGLPIVASEVGAIGDMLGSAGVLVAPNQASLLAEGLAPLLTDPAARSELGRAARARFLSNYTLQRFEGSWVDAISSALSTRSSGATRSRT